MTFQSTKCKSLLIELKIIISIFLKYSYFSKIFSMQTYRLIFIVNFLGSLKMYVIFRARDLKLSGINFYNHLEEQQMKLFTF